jgi:hypothetical protein
VTDADHEEFAAVDEPGPYRDLGLSDKVSWDVHGHIYVNDERRCCRWWLTRLLNRALGC